MLFGRMATLSITADWFLELGDEFERRTEGGDVVWWSGARTVYASVFHTSNADADAAIATMLEGRKETPVQTFDRAGPDLVSHAYLLPEREDGGDYWGLNTWTAARGSVACVTFYFESLDDLPWALRAWQSVQCGRCERYVN